MTDVNDVRFREWMVLGEARSKCEHLAGTPLRPDIARAMYEVTLVKGAQATTAIEGNTLTEEQVAGILRGSFKAPPSREYQEREVANVLHALIAIAEQVKTNSCPKITADLIREYNKLLLEGTESEDYVVPGEIRTYSVHAGPYVGAPAEDCEYLVERLAEWLESDTFRHEDPEIQFALAVAAAVYAHLYIAWIHPFGDGNGRTARLRRVPDPRALWDGSASCRAPVVESLQPHEGSVLPRARRSEPHTTDRWIHRVRGAGPR